ncbi:LacI family DNA-binding transcriptional regulator [Cellulomonas sp. JZ18]|nr:LacI family DNA-binding transcriptional regulator [Cellulomonas sp. JZ18]
MSRERRATIHHVAHAAGVSASTVSRVLDGRTGTAASTTARVLAVVDELGYESSLVARGLRSRRTHVVGVLAGRFEPFSSEIVKGAAAALVDTDYELLAYTGGRRGGGPGWERRLLSRLSGTLIDGAVLVRPRSTWRTCGHRAAARGPRLLRPLRRAHLARPRLADPHAGPAAAPAPGRARPVRRRPGRRGPRAGHGRPLPAAAVNGPAAPAVALRGVVRRLGAVRAAEGPTGPRSAAGAGRCRRRPRRARRRGAQR